MMCPASKKLNLAIKVLSLYAWYDKEDPQKIQRFKCYLSKPQCEEDPH